ncbi:MAG: alpha/beta fold hydrolase [Chromatiales bacterium]|nr:alpha/beta fold hydrolase [Chromatiales bacterium]
MKYLKGFLLVLTVLFCSATAKADVLVLVHGYLGSGHSWEQSGVNAVLEQNGWIRAGLLFSGPQGIQIIPVAGGDAANKVYAVELPSTAPLTLQADHLRAMLNTLSARHPDEPIILAGHSAGGVVARLALVRSGVGNIKALITIASPHLGTGRAIQALEATNSSGPTGFLKNMFGGSTYHTVKNSWGALLDLTPPRPGNMLYWLNGQTHPDIAYYSVVRSGPTGLGDELVPLYSQDMNNIPALQGKVEVRMAHAAHSLTPQDGATLVDILSAL